VEGAPRCLNPFGKLLQLWGALELVVAHRFADANQFLTNNASSTDGEVTNLGISHLLIWKTHVGSTRLDQGVGIGMPKSLHYRSVSLSNGIVFFFVSMPPTIKNGENHRSD
jgi:hypothetical protein